MTNKLTRLAFTPVSALILAGCASGYHSFYKPAAGTTPEAIAANRVSPPPAMPILERSAPADGETVLAAYKKRGYVMIGNSNFNSGKNETEASALMTGRIVGADLVLVFNPEYTGSITSSVPITTPNSTSSYSSSSATAYGPGGPVNAYGNATTTTYGSDTTYIPVTVHRSNYGAVYFVKNRFSFGAFFRDLNDAERQELQTNQGVVVGTIVDDSPAFTADVLPGDVIAAMDGVTVPNGAGFTRMIGERKGKHVTVTVIRRGQRIDKTVQLNNGAAA